MGNQRKGFYIVRSNVDNKGTHFLLELWVEKCLFFIRYIEKILSSTTKTAKITLLQISLNFFSSNKEIISHPVDLLNIVSKYKKFCCNAKYYNPKIHFCPIACVSSIVTRKEINR